MADWKKITFYWKNMLASTSSTITADSTAPGYDVANLANTLEINTWKAANANGIMVQWNAGSGQVYNGDFELGTTAGWLVWGDGGGSDFTFAVSGSPLYWAGSYKLTVTATNAGASTGAAAIYTSGSYPHTFKKGRTYKLLFAAISSLASHPVNIHIREALTPYGNLIGIVPTVTVTNAWASYEVTFVPTKDTDAGQLVFYMGGAGLVFEINNVMIVEEHDVCCDYIAIMNHNLHVGAANSQLWLQYSDMGTWDANDTTTGTVTGNAKVAGGYVMDKGTLLYEFPRTASHKYWRIVLNRSGGANLLPPEIGILMVGLKTELDWASAGFDPHEQTHKTNINISETGYVLGIHSKFVERKMTLVFNDADEVLYQKIADWRDNHGLKNFFVAWDLTNHTNEVYLMRSGHRYSNPFTLQGAYRNIRVQLTGRAA